MKLINDYWKANKDRNSQWADVLNSIQMMRETRGNAQSLQVIEDSKSSTKAFRKLYESFHSIYRIGRVGKCRHDVPQRKTVDSSGGVPHDASGMKNRASCVGESESSGDSLPSTVRL
jgi:hypothetical protein